ncbi:response regulator [Alcaligenaceae bacterium CGII-47]|nr:response regulator [Alcaligenaceae bacterium CGII-47]
MHLPGMDGIEFARMVRQAKPSLPVVFVSGYAAEVARCSVPGSVLITKPYSRERLASGIKQVLEWSAS